MKWTGYWLFGVAALHTVGAFLLYGSNIMGMAADGFFGSADVPADKEAFWFLIAGPFMFLAGLSILNMPKVSLSIGVTLGLIALVGVTFIPISGFWLIFPPAMALIRGSTRQAQTAV